MRAPALDQEIDHVRGPAGAPLIIEYGDYECPYSRQAFRAIEQVERRADGGIRFVFRHYPLTDIHPHALAASAAAEAAALQGHKTKRVAVRVGVSLAEVRSRGRRASSDLILHDR